LIFVSTMIVAVIKAWVFSRTTLAASTNLHNQVFRSVLSCPMSFFDTTPTGRILNRCETSLSFVFKFFISNLIRLNALPRYRPNKDCFLFLLGRYCHQMLSAILLSQFTVSSSRATKPSVPFGGWCRGQEASMISAVCSSAPHLQFAEGTKPHLCIVERKSPMPVRRRFSLTQDCFDFKQ